ncbi:hypothetical protein B0J12DRAFT_667656 [Macrophomina phaseolina]|uniref:Short-chain dehydrogenase/reductase SDR n=1 Tax=Macrophomina phaseolina TaxID=35725 RepID=A0ABQ8GB48_9PEZI|nr:hypothetical protein B0J12DRAFT_667656 [Macrophomina phaseolina]
MSDFKGVDLSGKTAIVTGASRALQISQTGKIEILIHSAAQGKEANLVDTTEDFYNTRFDTNVKGPIFLTKAVEPHLPRGGRIIFISSAGARLGVAGQTVYAATKAANEALVRVWAKELGQSHGITVNAVNQMVKLARYAREFEVVATMACVTFWKELVLEVERRIQEWSGEGYSDFCAAGLEEEARSLGAGGEGGESSWMTEEKANARQDRHHSAEAWRFALLLYIERVFKWNRTGPPSSILGLLARKTLNHVWSCRRQPVGARMTSRYSQHPDHLRYFAFSYL